jgi:hypothetical protein
VFASVAASASALASLALVSAAKREVAVLDFSDAKRDFLFSILFS